MDSGSGTQLNGLDVKTTTENIAGKTVCIIGGTAGMGRAVAIAALAQGARVLIGGRDSEKTSRIAGEIGATGQAIDTASETSVTAFFQAAGEIDHLVITASSVSTGPLRELPLADAEFTFRSKFFGPYLCAKYAHIPPAGSITFFSGILSRRPGANDAVLAGVNAAVEAMGRALARDLAPIRVNTISPGLTQGTSAFDAMPQAAREGMFQTVGARLPAGRVGTPEEIANALLFLINTPFVTGITLDVDGGGLLA